MPVDAISLEVFKNLFASVAEEMGVTLQRASFSPNIRERLDFSCAVFDKEARMVAQAAHIPVHLGSMPASVEYAVKTFQQLNEGDLIVLNDPYRGGTHLPDVTMVSPVFDGDGVAFYVASRAHHADVGGMSPGSLPLSTELYQEGLIIPPVLLRLSGWMNDGVFQMILANTRNPEERMGDIEAQLAAHRVGEMRLRDMLVQHGPPTVHEHAQALMAYSQRMTEAIVASIPDGTYSYVDMLESDGQAEFDIPICATINVSGSAMQVDFAGSAAQVLGNVNAVEAIVRSATWYCVRLLADEDVPVNHGCFAPVSVTTPAGSVVNPYFPAAVSVGNTETGQRVVDVVLGALAAALPDRIPAAGQGTMNNVTVGGWHQGRQFVYYETIGGGHGAGPAGNGLSGRQSHMTNTMNTPTESLEMTYPLRVWRYGLRPGSGGAGQHQGGMGIIREYEFLSEATVTLNMERRVKQPYGLADGEPGQVGVNTLIQNGVSRKVGAKFTTRVQPGDRLIIETPGGGGWGQAAR
ncbi:hydantoinase B/oxoprolinase family protein [Phototrophicus methaneseepsis]|uniref:Hydantoinase B/oxoprolinase family protein n=1 Tax=Phototrophicus methaneseepsis TaxID=2710758 RepID=A0A7S8E8A9_9CHLR|nr:hydantoinase B/oxoprolinase family protein [Phototrophicus methaneseepsis]QPC82211.1 hydantoinase B/oxoprolinase family protein [Phototrophicus methaneseepsis]